jgi:hypothetical protein
MKIKELLEELKGLDPELEVSIYARVYAGCNCPDYQEYCYCDTYQSQELNIDGISEKTEYSKKKKEQIVVGVSLNCS